MKKSFVALAIVFAAAATHAQSFDRTVGTGNVLPFSYWPSNTVVPQTGLESYAMVPRSRSAIDSRGRAAADANAPENTGGGTLGYNERLLHD